MRTAPSLLLAALLPLFSGCQMLADKPETVSTVGMTRLQGELSTAGGQLLFKPCEESRRFVVRDTGNTGLLQEASALAATPVPCSPTCAASWPAASRPATMASSTCNSCTASSTPPAPAATRTSSA